MAGVPVPLVDLRIRGDDGADAPWDGKSVGEIQVRGPVRHRLRITSVPPSRRQVHRRRLAAHRRCRARSTRSAIVRITDRTKDLIKSGGEWISSVDLENALMAHPAIAEAAVIAIPDAKWSERPLACIVCKHGAAIAPSGSRRARPSSARARLRQVAAARSLRGDRRRAAHVDRQVLEAEAARALPALTFLFPVRRRAIARRRRFL